MSYDPNSLPVGGSEAWEFWNPAREDGTPDGSPKELIGGGAYLSTASGKLADASAGNPMKVITALDIYFHDGLQI